MTGRLPRVLWRAALLLGTLACARPAASQVDVLQFEAASVRINRSGGPPGRIRTGPDSLAITNRPVRQVISDAFGIQLGPLLVNAPDWTARTRVDIVAKAPRPVPVRELQRMLQALLFERLKLAVRWEPREMNALALVRARRDGRPGPNLRESKADCEGIGTTNAFALVAPAPPNERPPCGLLPGGIGRILARGFTMAEFAASLVPNQQRPIVDRTGLAGRYDIELTYTPEAFSAEGLARRGAAPQPGVDPNGPSLFRALEDQLGLALEPTRAAVEVLVIDRIEMVQED